MSFPTMGGKEMESSLEERREWVPHMRDLIDLLQHSSHVPSHAKCMLEDVHAPIQRISDPFLSDIGIELSLKREDLIHPTISGNKWRKLK